MYYWPYGEPLPLICLLHTYLMFTVVLVQYCSRLRAVGKAKMQPTFSYQTRKLTDGRGYPVLHYSLMIKKNLLYSLFTTVHKGIHRPAFKIYQLTSQVIHYPSLMLYSSPAIRFQGNLLEWHNLPTITMSQQICAMGIEKLWRKSADG